METKKHFKAITNQEGSILAIAMLLLVVLSVLGTFAVNTANFEINIASNQQEWEENFNISEGGGMIQGTGIGYAGVGGQNTWYEIVDPSAYNNVLVPTTLANYDPYDDLETGFTIPSDSDLLDNPSLWPRQNLTGDINDDQYDYAYLTTYLYPQEAGSLKGYGVGTVSAYLFRINGSRKVIIEMGGKKIGVKNPL